MPVIPAKRTPYSAEQLRQSLAVAWTHHGVGSTVIDPSVLALLMALADLETGDGSPGGTVMPNAYHHNLGNIVLPSSLVPTTSQSVFTLSGDEGGGSGSSAPEHFYKVYPTHQAGAEGFVRQLVSDTRPHWRRGLLSGDPEEFVRALNGQRGGPSYFEANFARYLAAFRGRWQKYAPTPFDFEEEPTLPKAKPPNRGLPILLGLAILGLILRRSVSKRSG